MFDDKGNLTGAINMLVDVTEQSRYNELQKRTAELEKTTSALRISEERYHRMTAEVEDYAIILLSKDGLIENWNKGAEKIKGYTEQEAVGKSFKMFYPPEDQAAGLPEMLISRASVEGKANHEGWRVKKDGTRFWGSVTITALHDASNNVVGFSKVTRDLTERRERELKIHQFNEDLKVKNELLRQSEERYHRMVSQVEDYVIILLDTQGYIQNWNKGAQKIKGYSADEIIGKHFGLFYSHEDREKGLPEHLLNEALLNGKALHEGWRLRKDGSSFWGSVVMTALHNDDGEIIGFTKVTRDLTEKKLTEEKLLNSSLTLEQKNKELERINEELASFAYISSHDLQEPLRKIQTFSDRIMEMEYEKLSEKGKDYFKRMQAGASRMQKLIRDILSYSRTTTSEKKLELTDLNDLLNQAKGELDVMITEKKAVIQSDRLPSINVIPFQVLQLFNNLLNNALKFSKPDETPRILVNCEIVDGHNFHQTYPPPAKEYCHISFSDNGIGFEPEYSKKIFEVFQRLHGRNEYGGTGIGLAICKKIVENHNGLISAESQLGQGATFHIYLPFQ
jgi:PAS domain S-box-containing protein